MNPTFSERLVGFWLHVVMVLAANPAWLIVTVVAVCVVVAYACHQVARLEAWIGRRVAEHAASRCVAAEPEAVVDPESHAEHPGAEELLAEIFDRHVPTPPPARHDLHRAPPTRATGHRITRLRRTRHRNHSDH